ncbi:MAG: L-histidine N(alpha)-methyltransferase [Gemmatimonadetes bacterium]|nr:MAG: L-histidine N(alpha)-methyltransferase [Gemmatimonadota bacterium]
MECRGGEPVRGGRECTTGAAGEPAAGQRRARLLADLRWGLAQPQKSLPSKYFYDTRGSELFERITGLEEYYPTRVETELLRNHAPTWMAALAPATLVELGAGAATKTRILLDALVAVRPSVLYVPVDVAGDFLREVSHALRADYPTLEVRPLVRDISLPFPPDFPLERPALFALLGSTIGNFDPEAAVDLVATVRDAMAPSDRFLLGADLRPGPGKSKEALERAYNDAEGVTAEFNRNILRVFNREAGATFDLEAFEHRAFYDEAKGRIEMHLVARRPTTVEAPGMAPVRIAAGESIRTEISCKYDRRTVTEIFQDAGLSLEAWVEDEAGRYALALAGVSADGDGGPESRS